MTRSSEGKAKSDCSEVLRDVWLFLDDEMDPANRATVQHHLDDCSPCLTQAGLEQKLKAILHRGCGGDVAPAELRERVIATLMSAQITSESGHVQVSSLEVTVSSRTRAG